MVKKKKCLKHILYTKENGKIENKNIRLYCAESEACLVYNYGEI
jgi:hypothetical protein